MNNRISVLDDNFVMAQTVACLCHYWDMLLEPMRTYVIEVYASSWVWNRDDIFSDDHSFWVTLRDCFWLGSFIAFIVLSFSMFRCASF